MASDADYTAFLEKANRDTSGGGSAAAAQSAVGASSSSEGFAAARAVDTDVPEELLGVADYTYVSETDEPFEPVSLKWAHDELPSEDQFKELLDQKSDATTVTILSLRDFDPQNAYGDVMSAVTTAAAATTTATATAGEGGGKDGGSKGGGSKADDGAGQARVYCVRHGKTRCQYYIVAVDRRNARLVGVRAKAVET